MQLTLSDAERDLRVLFCTKLKWKNQVITDTNKPNQMFCHNKKSFTWFEIKLLQSLYLTFTYPLLEYAVPVWFPFLKSDCDNIEKNRHKTTKLVALIRNLSYERRFKALGLITLVERGQRGNLIQMYKFMHIIDKLDKGNCFPIISNQMRGNCFTRQLHKENFNRTMKL